MELLIARLQRNRARQAGSGWFAHPVRVLRDNLAWRQLADAEMREIEVSSHAAFPEIFALPQGDPRRQQLMDAVDRTKHRRWRDRLRSRKCLHLHRSRSLAPWFIDREIKRMARPKKRGSK